MPVPGSTNRGTGSRHWWDLKTSVCKKCGLPMDAGMEFPRELYFCGVTRAQWKEKRRTQSSGGDEHG